MSSASPDGSATARRPHVQGIASVPLDSLRPHPENPRRIRADRLEQLKRTLTADPEMLQARPLIALPDGTVVAGNMRLRAAQELGWETIPVVYADLDEQDARLWMLRDNNAFGEWDERPLAEMLAALDVGGVEVALAGFDGRTVDELLAGLQTERDRPDPDDVPPVPAVPRSRSGEVYELGPHRLLCGDAGDPEALAALMAGMAAQLVVTSPPYNQGLDKFKPSGMQRENPGWVERMAAAYPDSMPEADYQAGQVAVLDALLDVTSDDASVFYNHKHRYRSKTLVAPMSWISESGWRLRQEIVWDRSSSVTLNAKMFMPVDERIYWLVRSGRFVFANTASVKAWGTVWTIAPRAEVQASAPFPVEIPRRAITACSRRGDVVLDPFAGSGTTMIAADELGRRAFLMEISPGYCDVIRDRYEAWAR